MDYTPIGDGNTVVPTAGTPVTLTQASTPCNRVDIQALLTNSGNITVGGQTVSASIPKGITLEPGDVYNIEKLTDIVGIMIDALVDGDGVSYTYWKGEPN
jgi:hypothetical protein